MPVLALLTAIRVTAQANKAAPIREVSEEEQAMLKWKPFLRRLSLLGFSTDEIKAQLVDRGVTEDMAQKVVSCFTAKQSRP
jgi:hypothetical protein